MNISVRLEYSDEKSSRFWEVGVSGSSLTTRWGKIGAKGQSKERDFVSEEKAISSLKKLISEKIRKGYWYSSTREDGLLEAPTYFKTWVKGETPADFFEIIYNADWLEEKFTASDSVFLNDLNRKLEDLGSEGIVEFETPLTQSQVVALVRHEKSCQIKEVRYKSWETHPKKDPFNYYKEQLSKFKKVHGFFIPGFLLDIIRFNDLVLLDGMTDEKFTSGADDLGNLTNLVKDGFLKDIVSNNDIDEKGLLINRYSDHPFYYFPLCLYGADYVSWGIVFDFESESFSGFSQYWDIPYAGSYFDHLSWAIEGWLEGEVSDLRCADDYFVRRWFLQVLMPGYLNCHKVKRPLFKYGIDGAFCSKEPRIEEADILWRNNQTYDALKLLEKLSDDICPQFIKKTAQMHAVSRFDRTIYCG